MSVPVGGSPKQLKEAEERRQAHIEGYRQSAQAWWESGRRYYIVTLNLGGTVASLTYQDHHGGVDVSGTLQQIEAIGWELRDIGYVYRPLKERSSVLTDSAILTGDVLGIYTFVRPETSTPAPPV